MSFYDSFFKRKDSLKVLGHEISHLLYWKLTKVQKEEFARMSGWIIDREARKRYPPINPIYEDSVNSPSEDFANNVEAFYFDRDRLKKNNPALDEFFFRLDKDMK